MKRLALQRWIPFRLAALVAPLIAAWPQSVRAADVFWDRGSGTNAWGTAGNWSPTNAAAASTGALPLAADIAVFNISALTAAQTIDLGADRTIAGLRFVSSGSVLIQGGGANRLLNIGASGITKTANGAVTIGSTTANQAASIRLTADQTWANNTNTGIINVVNGASSSSAGPRLLTLGGSSTAANVVTGAVSNGSGTVSITKTGNGLWVLGGANTYSGGTTVSAGTLRGTVAGAFGANTSASAITLAGGTLELLNNTGTTFTNANTTVTGNATVTANRAASAGTSTTHALGALSIGAQTLTVARGGNITGTAVGGITFGATTLTDNATFAPGASAILNLGAVGDGGGGFKLTKAGVGSLVLTAAGTYSGGTDINNGSLQLNNNAAAGSGPITLNPGGATTATRLLVGGGVTIANPVTITGNIFGVAGQGSFQQTGTGQGRINGDITINGSPSAGGHFVGGTSAGNELVLAGPITSSIAGLSQRAGRVVYAGGGSGGSWNTLTVTDTAIVGANNGIPTGVSVVLGGSASATLDLAGFNQQLAGLTLGNLANAFSGNVTLGSGTLTLGGDITSQSDVAQNVTHVFSAAAGGTLDSGASNRVITLPNTLAADDMVISGASLTGAGGLTKAGAGTLALNNTTGSTTLAVSEGTLATGTSLSVGSATLGGLSFAGGSSLRMKVGSAGDAITVTNPGGLTATGPTTVDLSQIGGAMPVGNYPLISYSGTSPGVANFTLSPASALGHATASLVDTGTAIAVNIAGNDKVVWDGTNSTAWATGATGNWKLQTGGAQTDFIAGDDVVFADSPVTGTVAIAANVEPSNVTFTNTTATPYSLTGTAGITGMTGLMKSGNGTVTIANPNAYVGPTAILAGTLNLSGGSVAGTAISVAAGATLSQNTTGSITGAASLTTSGSVLLGGPNTYTGPTTVNSGTLELDANSGTLANTSGVNVAAGATFRITRDGTGTSTTTTFNRNLSGSGNLEINIRDTTGTTAADAIVLSGANGGFSGNIRLLSPADGTYRLQQPTPAHLGTGSIEVQNGAQLFVSGANAYDNNVAISGTGYADANGNIGAFRFDGATWNGNVTVSPGGARIGSHNATGTIAGSITGGDLEVNASNYNTTNYTAIFTGANAYGTTTIGGQASAGTGTNTMRLNIGNGGTTGTLGLGAVTINGDGMNGVLGFDRSDGYTLLLGQTITGGTGGGTIADSIRRTFVDFDTTGAGFDNAGNTISLGTTAVGGNLRFGQARANTVTTLTGNITSQNFNVGSNAPNATVNLNSTANVSADFIQLGVGAAVNAANTLNINSGATVTANRLFAGQVSGGIGIINQAEGSTVSVETQLRVGHFGNNASAYNMAGGTLTMTGVSPDLTPSTPNAGGASATGDNNINALVTPAFVGGGIYLGIDGTGVFNHTGGTLTTNWIVLDNRGASGAGVNMPDGIDRYNLSGAGSVLNLRSNWGLIGRNDGSYVVSFGGGTVRVDDTGTGTGTGPNINIPLDATIDTVAATTTTLDTNAGVNTGNAFTLTKDVRGTGTLNLTGGGTVNFSTAGAQNISAPLTVSGAGANLAKQGTGTTTLSGNLSGYTGNVSVAAGRLNVPASLGAGAISVADGAALGGEPVAVTTLTLGATTGGTLFFDPNTAGAITASSLVVNGASTLDFASLPTTAGPWTAINYTTRSGAGTLEVANPGNFRVAPAVTDTGSAITVNITGTKILTWTGAASGVWDINNAINWADTVPAAEKFFTADTVVFPEGGANPAITVTGMLMPNGVVVNAATTAYTLNSTAGNQITGATGITKTGNGSLTLAGPNAYSGQTSVGGGTLNYGAANSLGDGSSTNGIAISGGGRLVQTGAAALDLGVNRAITVGAGGGALSHNNATGAAVTVSGNLSGNGPLSFHSAAAGAGTFILTGNNSGYNGDITVDAPAAAAGGLTALRIANSAAAPGGGSITLNFPAAGAAGGDATTLNLPGGVTLPAGLALRMTSGFNGANSMRTQVTSAGNNTINGPITAAGTSIVQFNQGAGTLTYNGSIAETSPGAFTNVVFFRGTGTHIVNGTINLPTAGSSISVTDGATVVINSSGNTLAGVQSVFGTVRLGASNALGTTNPTLLIGQGGDQAATLDLNGFDQSVGNISFAAPTGNLTTKGVSNSNASATSTFTVDQTVDASFNGTFTGRIDLVKTGANNLTLPAGNSNFSGNVTVNNGTLTAAAVAANAGGNGPLGAVNVPGKTITVNAGATLSFASNNVFGNQTNVSYPATVINEATLASTRYNALGDVTLNGGTLTQAATDGPGAYEGYQFRGAVNVGGTAASTISTTNGKANHLAADTVFTVADATGSAAADLIVTSPLRNQSGDFGGAAGGFTKEGPGTMSLAGVHSYTGPTTVNAGTLFLEAGSSIASSSLTTLAGGTLAGTGTVGSVSLTGGVLSPGASPGILTTGNVTTSAGSTVALEIGGLTAGTEFDRIVSNGTVTIGGGTLSVSLINSFIPAAYETFLVWENDDTDLFAGVFGGLAEGASLPIPETSGTPGLDTDYWMVTYQGGSGNDLVLTYVPEPGSAALALAGALPFLRRRRRAA